MTWALDQQDVTDSISRHVLLCLANYADKDGKNAFPSASTLAQDTGLAVRTVRVRLGQLLEAGIIKKGNQMIVAAHIPAADRRPVCYDLVMSRGACGAPREGEQGARHDTNGVHATTERGARRAPNPSYNHQKENRTPVVPVGDNTADSLALENPASEEGTDPLEAIVSAYNRILGGRPGCRASLTTTPKLCRALGRASTMAQTVCKQHGLVFEQTEFWEVYFTSCLDDKWLRGDTPNPNNAKWKQSLPTLIDEDRFAQIMDTVLSEMLEGQE